MASENVEIARAAYGLIEHYYATGDEEPIRRHMKDRFDPGCVLSAGPNVFLEGTWSGHDGILRFMTSQREVFRDMWIEPLDYIEVGDDWLVGPGKSRGHPRHTGIDLELGAVHAFHIHDGRAKEFRIFHALEDALAELGAQPSTER